MFFFSFLVVSPAEKNIASKYNFHSWNLNYVIRLKVDKINLMCKSEQESPSWHSSLNVNKTNNETKKIINYEQSLSLSWSPYVAYK